MTRFFMKFIAVLALIAASCLAYGFFIEPKRLVIKHHTVEVSNALERPLKIGVISDIHIGGYHMPPKRVEKIISRLNRFDLNMVLIAGDFINGHKPRAETSKEFDAIIDAGLKAFNQLQSSYGSFAVIGNHDVWYDPSYVEEALEAANVSTLTNEALQIESNICLVGLADNMTQKEDPKSFSGCKENNFIIAVMHSPDSFRVLRSDVQFAVAGHTHAGQINIPMFADYSHIIELSREYKYGLEVYNGVPVYVSAGLGTSVLPARFRAPPEITIITLEAQKGSQ